ncbi:MAG TPA: YdcH family protein, partial [Gammaproteobacteria bacterium]
DNEDFQQLYKQHNDLKEKVRSAELGVLPLDDATLGTMKKEKLLTKDKMAAMIEQYRREHA